LYQTLQLRSNVFVIEKQVIRHELNGTDLTSHHVIGELDGIVIVTSRFFESRNGVHDRNLGSICVALEYRKLGVGRKLMEFSLQEADKKWTAIFLLQLTRHCLLNHSLQV